MPAPSPSAEPTGARSAGSSATEPPPGQTDADVRRRFWLAIVGLFGVLAVLFVFMLVTAPWSEGSSAQRAQNHRDAVSQPQSIAPPDYGQKPQHPGDPGGWEQLALLGLLVVAIGSGVAWVVHTSRRAKRARARRGGTPPSGVPQPS